MKDQKFVPSQTLQFGFASAINNFRLFFLVHLIILGIMLLSAIVFLISLGVSLPGLMMLGKKFAVGCQATECTSALQQFFSSLTIHFIPVVLIALLWAFVLCAYFAGYMRITLDIYDTGSSTISRLFAWRLAPKIFIAYVLLMLVCFAGFLLFIFPGFYFLFRFFFVLYFIVDTNMGIMDSFRASWVLTRGQGWSWLSVMFVVTALSLLSSLIALLAWPFAMLCYAYMYRKLERATPAV